jgi:hypothetical protein
MLMKRTRSKGTMRISDAGVILDRMIKDNPANQRLVTGGARSCRSGATGIECQRIRIQAAQFRVSRSNSPLLTKVVFTIKGETSK